ncbi:M16 family metallopeptidase [Zavarzinella formosa]|uniref:M16 family metallopeptidase n=1 Tax=Zavarzinella formosa TaxID=360055 RepID=UPI00030D852A|nr:pitrilysin family protein [Zavarzinella formosa]
MPFHHQTLANGLTILGESNPAALSVAVAFWVKTGSRDEQPAESGVSHFLEHMVFKGTERRNAYTVNRDFSVIGADNNAWTSEENTVFHAVVLPEFLPQLVDVLADIMRPSLRTEDFDTEKKVILDEIVRYEVQPGWASFDLARKNFYGSHPLGNSVLGTSESITALKQTQMLDYFQRRYGASNIVAVATGNFDFAEFSKLVKARCESWPSGITGRGNRTETPGQGGLHMLAKPPEKVSQQYMTLIAPGPAANSELSYAAAVLATAVGDYSGSRMYWALTDPGLADEAGMGMDECDGAGAYCTSFNGDPENAPECFGIVQDLLHEVQRTGLTQAEFEQAKTKILSRELRAGERSSRRMLTVAKDWVYRDMYRTVDDEMKSWDAVTMNDIRAVLDKYPLTNQTVTGYGPLSTIEG